MLNQTNPKLNHWTTTTEITTAQGCQSTEYLAKRVLAVCFFIYCVYMRDCVYILQCVCGVQRTTWRSQYSPLVMCVPWLELRLSHLVAIFTGPHLLPYRWFSWQISHFSYLMFQEDLACYCALLKWKSTLQTSVGGACCISYRIDGYRP